jgi:hypothetical protein
MHHATVRIGKRKFGSETADGENLLLNAGRKQFCDSVFAGLQTLRLNQTPGLFADLVELVLKRGHFVFLIYRPVRMLASEPISRRCTAPPLPIDLNILRIWTYWRSI